MRQTRFRRVNEQAVLEVNAAHDPIVNIVEAQDHTRNASPHASVQLSGIYEVILVLSPDNRKPQQSTDCDASPWNRMIQSCGGTRLLRM